jgi:hypothetical protein
MFCHIDCFVLKMGKPCSCETSITVYQSVTIYQLMQCNISEHHCEEHRFWSSDYFHVPLHPDIFLRCLVSVPVDVCLTVDIIQEWSSLYSHLGSVTHPSTAGVNWQRMILDLSNCTQNKTRVCMSWLWIMLLDVRHLIPLSRFPHDQNGLVQGVFSLYASWLLWWSWLS